MKTKTLRTNQSGSIMLEVVAVLALMGIMGAMLFRQIYQRNQELHNIQMASEIRTVKEAFSAYIQANRSSILATNCTVIPRDDKVEQCTGGNFEDIYNGVAYYLPDGWFNADDLEGAYTLSLWNYLIENDSEKRIVYGIVVPTTDTLPTTGWNFKRAARVALLIGADGGAYDPSITNGEISGSLGAWQIQNCDEGHHCLIDDSTYPDGTYVATTGIDVFAPEYEMPEGDMKLPNDWSLALKGLHAYNHFSVGNSGSGNCYSIQHNRYASSTTGDNVEGKVENDTVPSGLSNDCKPLFWVGSETGGANANAGNVYVATDLKIGDIEGNAHNEALTLTKEGVIKQKDGITITADGRILSRDKVNVNTGELKAGEYFMLDPGRTSVMGDIILSSRGGVRLSDILPNYILKEQKTISCQIGTNGFCSTDITITKPSCPTDYKIALVVIPTVFGRNFVPAGITTGDSSSTDPHTHSLDINRGKFMLKLSSGGDVPADGEDKSSGVWSISMGYGRNVDITVSEETIHAIAQTYCVWAPSFYDGDETKCTSAGYTYVGGKCTTIHGQDPNRDDAGGAEIDEDVCTAYGYTWETSLDPDRCVFKFVDSLDSKLNNTSNLNKCMQVATTHLGSPTFKSHYETQAEAFARRAAVCKAAGYKWTQTSSTEGCCGNDCTPVGVPNSNCRS